PTHAVRRPEASHQGTDGGGETLVAALERLARSHLRRQGGDPILCLSEPGAHGALLLAQGDDLRADILQADRCLLELRPALLGPRAEALPLLLEGLELVAEPLFPRLHLLRQLTRFPPPPLGRGALPLQRRKLPRELPSPRRR